MYACIITHPGLAVLWAVIPFLGGFVLGSLLRWFAVGAGNRPRA